MELRKRTTKNIMLHNLIVTLNGGGGCWWWGLEPSLNLQKLLLPVTSRIVSTNPFVIHYSGKHQRAFNTKDTDGY